MFYETETSGIIEGRKKGVKAKKKKKHPNILNENGGYRYR